MTSLLHNLLLDLDRRGRGVLKELNLQGTNLSPEFETHRKEAIVRVNRALVVVQDLLTDPDLATPQLEQNFFIYFKRLTEFILSVEDTSLLILKRCSPDDQFLSAVLRQICSEVGYTDTPPLCSALSFQYFQALVDTDVILTSQTQSSELLSLPDLYHELAHFVVFRRREEFELPILKLIHEHFENQVRKGKQHNSPQASLDKIKNHYSRWVGSWHVEFACDMIATYWCGPAYGLANLRLSATRGDPYEDSPSHPADYARRAGIECMLKLCGETGAAGETEMMWDDLKRLSASSQPSGYAKKYPSPLLEQMAECIYKLCVQSGFRKFSQHQANGAFVSCTVAEAWNEFQRDAVCFPIHETSMIESLKRKLVLA